jgi:hypothetical protein
LKLSSNVEEVITTLYLHAMTLPRILLYSAICVGLFVLFLVSTLWPTVRNVSSRQELQSFVKKKIILKKVAFLKVNCESGDFRFIKNILTENDGEACGKNYSLPAGSQIEILDFKTYKSNLGSGFTFLYAIGVFETELKEKISFEYSWGSVDKSLYSDKTPPLPRAPWQDENDALINFTLD